MRFKTGESVVCIDDDFSWSMKYYAKYNITYPVLGKCYVVRSYLCGGKKPALALQGITNPNVMYVDGVIREAGFWDRRFARAPRIDGLKKIAVEATTWGRGRVKEDAE